MAGPSLLALIVAGPRSGERVTVTGDDRGNPPQVIELPDRVVLRTAAAPADDQPPSAARYELTGHDAARNAYIYVHVPK